MMTSGLGYWFSFHSVDNKTVMVSVILFFNPDFSTHSSPTLILILLEWNQPDTAAFHYPVQPKHVLRISQPYKSPLKGWERIVFFEKEKQSVSDREGPGLLLKHRRGDWDHIQGALFCSWDGLNSWVQRGPGEQDQLKSRWVGPPGSGLSAQTGTRAPEPPSQPVMSSPPVLYYDYNPPIKSRSRRMRSRLTNERESTLWLCVDFRPQSWTPAKADTWLLPPLSNERLECGDFML